MIIPMQTSTEGAKSDKVILEKCRVQTLCFGMGVHNPKKGIR